MKLIFAGSADFAVPPLIELNKAHDISAVLTKPDRPSGRGRKLSPSPVKVCARNLSLTVLQPENLRTKDTLTRLKSLAPDVIIVVAYGIILPPEVLSIPRYGCLNIHASILPRWRGAAPIQRAIMAGDKESGITIMQMDEGLDTGDIIIRRKTSISPEDTGASLHEYLSRLGADAIIQALINIAQDKAKHMPQDGAKATYADKISKHEAVINWQDKSSSIVNKIRAFNPWPVAVTSLNGKILRIWQARISAAKPDHRPAPAGTIIKLDKQGIEVGAQDGSVIIQSLQLPGKKPVSAEDFINSSPAITPGLTGFD